MSFLNHLINGISLGSIYAIIALGYTMVYGIAKMLNFAHGDLDGAKIFAEEIKKQYGIEPEIRIMGPTIGCHVGPGAVAFTFVSNELRP